MGRLAPGTCLCQGPFPFLCSVLYTREKQGVFYRGIGVDKLCNTRSGNLLTSPTCSFPQTLWDSHPSCHASASQKHPPPVSGRQTKAGMARTYLLTPGKSYSEPEIQILIL